MKIILYFTRPTVLSYNLVKLHLHHKEFDMTCIEKFKIYLMQLQYYKIILQISIESARLQNAVSHSSCISSYHVDDI